MAASYMIRPVLESLFGSEYCEIFKTSYFEEHLRTTASENVFMKLRKIKIQKEFGFYIKKSMSIFNINIRNNNCFLLHNWFSMMFVFTYNI